MSYRNLGRQAWRFRDLCPMCGDAGTRVVGARLYCNEHARELLAFSRRVPLDRDEMSAEGDSRLALRVTP